MAGKNFNVTLPRKSEDLMTLSEHIQTKHVNDGSASLLLNAWVQELKTLTDTAKTEDARQKEFQRNAKEFLEAINVELGVGKGQSSFGGETMLNAVLGMRDFLRGHFRDNPRALGAWGFSVKAPKGVPQIETPRDAEGLMKLASDIVAKHVKDKSESLLVSFDFTKLNDQLQRIQPKWTETLQARKSAEQATQNRDRALGKAKGQTSKTRGTALFLVASIRDVLLGRYRGSERTLGEWGFEVNDASVGGKTITPPLPPTT